MWTLHLLGDPVPMQPGRDGLERGVSAGQLPALLLPAVQTPTGEFHSVLLSLRIQAIPVIHQLGIMGSIPGNLLAAPAQG